MEYAIMFAFGFLLFGGQLVWNVGGVRYMEGIDWVALFWFGALFGGAFCLALYGAQFIPE